MMAQSFPFISKCFVEPVRPITNILLVHSEDFLEVYKSI